MRGMTFKALGLFCIVLLAACTPSPDRIASTADPVPRRTDWAFAKSDVPLDRDFHFGQLANGLRYVVRRNTLPKGTILVRLEFAVGSLDEAESERGFAHFTEHMAFNGSTHLPEGEMVRLLERHGLAFGSDNNAATTFKTTTYILDLPRNDRPLLDLSLMLLREMCSELLFSPDAVDRARGVILSEMRERNTWQFRNRLAQARFLHPGALYPDRFPIGESETVKAATAEGLKAFWRREYVPAKATVVVVGDIDPASAEALIRSRFGSWRSAADVPQVDPGPVDASAGGRTQIRLDEALSERVTAARHAPWIGGRDTVARRRENLLRRIGYAMINRRLARLARQPNPPFRAAGLGTADVFRSGRTTTLAVESADGAWRQGLVAAAIEYRRALSFGFTDAEVAEQVAVIRTDVENAAASAATRTNSALVSAVFDLLRDDLVPSKPQGILARFRQFAPQITKDAIFAALQREAVPLDDPLLRFEGRWQPQGGGDALRAAWDEGMRAPLKRGLPATTPPFAYARFGTPGTVASDSREGALGIRQVRFANGVMLNLKRTRIERGRVLVQASVDGGEMLDTRDNPLAVHMMRVLWVGGLGHHTLDDMQSILAGHTVSTGIAADTETFVSNARTTPQDLELQLQVYAAMLTDPGYRREGELQYRLNINYFFAQRNATPASALANAIGGILSGDDPRFTLQPQQDYRNLTFDKLRRDISDRFAHGAIEIGIVGDIDERQVIAIVARTFGALPAREPAFLPYEAMRSRPFTGQGGSHIIRHDGPADQALLRLTWATRDDSDPEQSLALELLERVVLINLTETLRGRLGKTYTPEAASAPSRFWRGFGTFGIAVQTDVHEVPVTRAAILETVSRLRDAPAAADLFQRARQPLLEAIDNGLKTNSGWLNLVGRAQSRADLIDRQTQARQRLLALRSSDIQALAKRYLAPDQAVEALVLPKGVDVPQSNSR